jgi:methionyl-tRNA synthetase
MKKYITTPIYYINTKPHLGHAYTTIAADVLARHYRQKGDEVFFLTGTDEHGAKIAEAAKSAGQQPKIFADQISKLYEDLSGILNFSNDAFIRTTDPRHEKIVQEFLQKLYDKELIYEKEYTGLYCVGCEKFLTDKDLVEGKCPDHKTVPQSQSEKNWFFKLSQFESQIKNLIESDEIKVLPQTRKNEILSKVDQGLEDISISRAGVEWGIPIPWDEKQTVYVWVDALINYWSAPIIEQGKKLKVKSEKYESDSELNTTDDKQLTTDDCFWPPDLHLVGRDIMWFHAVIWPAILLAAEEKLPKEIFVQGYFTVDGQKMSKTIGNVIDPVELVDKFGADSVRYYVLRDFPYGEDGDVSLARLKERHNNDLAAGLGNLVQRVLSMVKRYGVEPSVVGRQSSVDSAEDDKRQTTNDKQIEDLTENLKFQEALIEIWKEIAKVNKEIAEVEPWNLEKQGKKKELDQFLQKCYARVLEISDLVAPYLPETAENIKLQAKSLDLKPIFEKKL